MLSPEQFEKPNYDEVSEIFRYWTAAYPPAAFNGAMDVFLVT
jgi:hypothetical protein